MKTQKILMMFVCIILLSLFATAEKTIEVNEGELVNLKISARDEDEDVLSYSFSKPLDENGTWQTDYGDAGEYLITVTASDNKTETKQTVKLIVHRSNRPPVLKELNDMVVNEGETINIHPEATDEEGDEITYTISEPIGNDGRWETTHQDAGEYLITVTASDNKHEPVSKKFKIIVKDINQEPAILDYNPRKDIELKEGEIQTFSIQIEDYDKDTLEYEWGLDNKTISKNKTFTYNPGFESAGTHIIRGSASDGKIRKGVSWNIEVINNNRAPKIENIKDRTIKEGESIRIYPQARDPDGDEIFFDFEEPLDEDGAWKTDYEDAREYSIEVTASDNEDKSTETFNLVVENVDRAPEFEEIEPIEIKEGENIEIELKAEDPDGDEIKFSAEKIPAGASLENNKFIFETDYETLHKPKQWTTKLLKNIKIDNLVYKNKKTFKIDLIASGKEKSTKQKLEITVNNVNRKPKLLNMEDIYINEGETAYINPKVIEKDNDRVKFTISDPVGNDGEWETNYEDAGTYTIEINASDGQSQDSQKMNIIVNNVNREPEFEDIEPIDIKEGETAIISPVVSDPDNDEIELSIQELPVGAKFEDNTFTWKPNYDIIDVKDGKKSYKLKFIASDQESNVSKQVTISVKNKNRAPQFIDTEPASSIRVYKGIPILFKANAKDPDNDKLTYSWKFGLLDKITNSTPGLRRTFTSNGDKKIKLIVSDGDKSIEKTWNVEVVNNPLNKITPKVIEKSDSEDKEKTTTPKTHTLTIV